MENLRSEHIRMFRLLFSTIWLVNIGVVQLVEGTTPWVIDFLPSSTNTDQSSSTETWLPPEVQGSGFSFHGNIPTLENDIFMGVQYTGLLTSSIRLFSRTGTLNLLYNSG